MNLNRHFVTGTAPFKTLEREDKSCFGAYFNICLSEMNIDSVKINVSLVMRRKNSLEPDLNQRPMDVWQLQLQSTALPTELSRDV